MLIDADEERAMGDSDADEPSSGASELTRRGLLQRGAVGGSALLFSGALPLPALAAGTKQSEIWRIGFNSSTFRPVNPFLYGDYPSYYSIHCLFPTLVDYDQRTGNAVGDLAQSWSASPDGLAWTFRLRRGGWSDGRPLTARDVGASLGLAKKFAKGSKLTSYYTGQVANIKSWTVRDAQTIVIRLKKSDYQMPLSLKEFWIVPAHIWAVGGGQVDAISGIGERAPIVGGGPYSLTRLDETSAVLTENPNWHGAKPRTPFFGIRNYRSDDALLLALQKKEVDIAPAFSGVVRPARLPRSVKLLEAPNTAAVWLLTNFAQGRPEAELRLPAVRRALSLAINRSAVVRLSYNGLAVPESTVVFSATKGWHNTAIRPDPYDPAQANRLLDGLGFRRGGDGIRVADGRRMSYPILVTDGVNQQFLTLAEQYLRAIGVGVEYKTLDVAAWDAAMRAHKWTLTLAVVYGSGDPLYWLDQFTTDKSYHFAGGVYETGYSKARYDALHKQLRSGVSTARAKQLGNQLQQILAADRPVIPIVNPQLVALMGRGVTGVAPGPFGAPTPQNQASWARIRVEV